MADKSHSEGSPKQRWSSQEGGGQDFPQQDEKDFSQTHFRVYPSLVSRRLVM